MDLNQKYEVRKAGETTPLDPDTFFVIRKSDVFGAVGIMAYAGTIQSALELEELALSHGRHGFFTFEERGRLMSLCDAMMDVSREWGKDMDGKKVPD
jgi:hypothetical protein